MILADLEQNLLSQPTACLTVANFLLESNSTALVNPVDKYSLALYLLAHANNLPAAKELALQTLQQHPQWPALTQPYPELAKTQCLITDQQLLAVIKTVKKALNDAAAASQDIAIRSKLDALKTIIHEWPKLGFADLIAVLENTNIQQALVDKYKTSAVIPIALLMLTPEHLNKQQIPPLAQLAEELRRRQQLQAIAKRQGVTVAKPAQDSIADIEEQQNNLLMQFNLQQYVPDPFLCPLTGQIFGDPVIISDGTTFEREAIIEHLNKFDTNPVTGDVLANRLFVSNIALKNLINDALATFAFVNPAQAKTPNEFYCPVSLTIMVEPVITSDGRTYEKEQIETWYNKGSETSPLTRATITAGSLIPNLALKKLIEGYLKLHPELYEEDKVYLPQAYKDLMYQAVMSRDMAEVERLVELDPRLWTENINNDCNTLLYTLTGPYTETEILALIDKYAIKNQPLTDLLAICGICIHHRYHVLLKRYLSKANNIINARDNKSGRTLLHLAILADNKAAIELLLSLGADVHAKSSDGSTALMYAVQKQNVNLFEALLQQDVELKSKADEQRGVLFYCLNTKLCAKLVQYLIAKELLAAGSNVTHAAVYLGDYAALEAICDSVSITNFQPDVNGNTPLHLAVQLNNFPIASRLMHADAGQICISNNIRELPLNIALKNKSYALTQLLLGRFAQLGLTHLSDDDLKFLLGCLKENTNLQTLILHECTITPITLTELSITLKAHSTLSSRLRNIKFKFGCKITFETISSLIALLKINKSPCLLSFESIEIVNMPDFADPNHTILIKNACNQVLDLNNIELAQALRSSMLAAMHLNKTASLMHLAAYLDNVKALRYLQEKTDFSTADEDSNGNTPLHYAVKGKCTAAIKSLVNLESINKANKDGQTPLNLAYQINDKATLKLLWPLQADISYQPENDQDVEDLIAALYPINRLESLSFPGYTLSNEQLYTIYLTSLNKQRFKRLIAHVNQLTLSMLYNIKRNEFDYNITFGCLDLSENKSARDGLIQDIPPILDKGQCKRLNLANSQLALLDRPFRSSSLTMLPAFYQALGTNQSLEHIDLSNNGLVDKDIIVIAAAFKDNRTLKELNLAGNTMTNAAALALAKAFRNNQRLEKLEIDGSLNYFTRLALSNALNADVVVTEGNKLIFMRRSSTAPTPRLEHQTYIKEIQHLIEKTDWKIGFFGGERVRLGDKDFVVPKGVRLMLDEIQQAITAKDRNPEQAWNEAKAKIVTIASERKARRHSFFNRQHETTTEFYNTIIETSICPAK